MQASHQAPPFREKGIDNMKLTIARKQTEQTDRKGRSEGVLFEFSCRLELNPQESGLVEKHGRAAYPMGQITDRHGDPSKSIITLTRLREGMSMTTRFVSDVIATENTVKEACGDFKGLLGTLENYGGQDVIEY